MTSGVGAGTRLRRALPQDLTAVLELLRAAGLPVDGVEAAFVHFIVAEADARIVGAAGLEVHGTDGLLRSVAVANDWRGRGLGGVLTEEVLHLAKEEGLGDLYLLTETAADFFPRHGFRRIARSDVSAAVQSSAEFTALCPTTSIAMVRQVRAAS